MDDSLSQHLLTPVESTPMPLSQRFYFAWTYICTCFRAEVLFCFVSLLATSIIRGDEEHEVALRYRDTLEPFVGKYCLECHNAEVRESGIRVDLLDERFDDATLKLWEVIEKLVEQKEMPPAEVAQPTREEREKFLVDLEKALAWARTRDVPRLGSIRRMTVSQYALTLKELLGIDEELTTILPPDGISKEGFSNSSQTLQLNPIQLESYLQIAERALDLVMIDEAATPRVQTFQMELGRGINKTPYPGELVLGALNHLLPNQDFEVTEVAPSKPFSFLPRIMQRKFRFIEGYQGNDTVRAWREFDSIYHAVFACMRGSEGYPKGRAYESVLDGLLLRPAIPSSEIFGESSTYGPHANFKIALRELPEQGNFRIRVWAAKYEDGLLLDADDLPIGKDVANRKEFRLPDGLAKSVIDVPEDAIYQVDLATPQMLAAELSGTSAESAAPSDVQLQIGERVFGRTHAQQPFMLVRLQRGPVEVSVTPPPSGGDSRLVLAKLDESDPNFHRFIKFEARHPALGVYLGLRRDCGSTLNLVGTPREVSGTALQEYIFEGAINNFARPEVETDNVNYLAGIREIGIRCGYTDGRDMPRLRIRKIEFEGPFYEQWPPANYVDLMQSSALGLGERELAERVIRRFATRAFRRPVLESEVASLLKIWEASGNSESFAAKIRPVLLVILTSPQFLFLIEKSDSAAGELLDEWELASKLSYFLWNGPPNSWLEDLARRGELRSNLKDVLTTMLEDQRYCTGADSFVSQWLSLDKFDVVSTDSKKFPRLTRTVKAELRKEPTEFWLQKVRNGSKLKDLFRSNEVVVNDVLASYYGLGDVVESGLEFTVARHDKKELGGILSFGAVHAGLSDGREPNPVKRGAWLARKIIAEPPGDPPPNVPALEDLSQLTLRQRLEKHRDVSGCAKCHEGIDPWGLPFEEFDAGGLHRSEAVDSTTVLADGRKIESFEAFRDFLIEEKIDQLAFSLAKHLSIYANGKSLSYKDELDLKQRLLGLKTSEYRLPDILEMVITSDAFQLK